MNKPSYIFIHHTEVSYDKNPDQWTATNNYHRDHVWGYTASGAPIRTPISSLGYYGGYNYEVSKNGSIHQFRQDGEETVAQYQQGMNDGRALSICMDGDFDNEDPTDAQKKAVSDWLADKMAKYGIPKENVFCHRKVALGSDGLPYKTCPGSRLPDDIYHYFIPEVVEIPEWAQSSVDKAKSTGRITHWDNPYLVVGTETLEYSLEKSGLLDPTKHEGKVTLLRWACALDKAGLLK